MKAFSQAMRQQFADMTDSIRLMTQSMQQEQLVAVTAMQQQQAALLSGMQSALPDDRREALNNLWEEVKAFYAG